MIKGDKNMINWWQETAHRFLHTVVYSEAGIYQASAMLVIFLLLLVLSVSCKEELFDNGYNL